MIRDPFFQKSPVVALFHAVMPSTPLWLSNLYQARTPQQFEADLDGLLKYFEPLLPEDLIRHRGPKRPMIITFDDGLSCFADYAWPILKAKGIPVILFVNPTFAEGNGIMYRYLASSLVSHCSSLSKSEVLSINYSNKSKLYQWDQELGKGCIQQNLLKEHIYLSTKQLLQLRDEGVVMGAHTLDHPDMHLLPEEMAREQVLESLTWVEQMLHEPQRLFAFPFTDQGMSISFMQWLSKEVEWSFGTAGFKRDFFSNHVHRIPIEKSNHTAYHTVKQQIDLYPLKRLLGKHIVARHP